MKANSRRRYRTVTAVLSVAAVALLALGSITGARAALTYSTTFRSNFGTQGIAVRMVEQSDGGSEKTVSDGGALLDGLNGEGESFVVGKQYEESLLVENPGEIDAYVRVTLHKYWLKDGEKQRDLSPNLISLEMAGNDWIVVDEDPDDETVVLYYKNPVPANGGRTSAALTGLKVDNRIRNMVKQTSSGGTITTSYAYDGVSVGLDASIDAIQTHWAHDAMLSAWGVDVTVGADGSIQGVE